MYLEQVTVDGKPMWEWRCDACGHVHVANETAVQGLLGKGGH